MCHMIQKTLKWYKVIKTSIISADGALNVRKQIFVAAPLNKW